MLTWYHILLITLTCLAVGVALGYQLGRRRVAPAVAQAVEDASHAVDDWRTQAGDWERRAGEYRSVITVAQEERNTWREKYFEQAAGHDTAQSMMMNEIDSLVFQHRRATKKMPHRNAAISQIRAAFAGSHGEAVAEYHHDKGVSRDDRSRQADRAALEAVDDKPEKAE